MLITSSMRLPALRYVTQAGGRLAPDRVVRYAVGVVTKPSVVLLDAVLPTT